MTTNMVLIGLDSINDLSQKSGPFLNTRAVEIGTPPFKVPILRPLAIKATPRYPAYTKEHITRNPPKVVLDPWKQPDKGLLSGPTLSN